MNSRARCRGADGHAAIEAAIAVTGLLLLLMLVVGGLRLTNSGGEVKAAARAAARAAAVEYDPSAGRAAAQQVAAAALADRGVACQGLNVAVAGDWSPGGLVTVDVTCQVALGDVTLAGFPGAKTLTGHAVEAVDVLRGDG